MLRIVDLWLRRDLTLVCQTAAESSKDQGRNGGWRWMGVVGWKSRGLCWRVRDGYVPGLHYSLEPLFSSDKNEKNCPPSLPASATVSVTASRTESINPSSTLISRTIPFFPSLFFPPPPSFSSPLLPYPPFESALRDMSTKLGDTHRGLASNRSSLLCVWLHVSCLSHSFSLAPFSFISFFLFLIIHLFIFAFLIRDTFFFFFGIILLTSLLQPLIISL